MDETNMNDMNPCGNHEALIAYLYDECEPPKRESIAAHVALCAVCTDEIQSLRDTRAHLGAWSPPSTALGFQIVRTEADQPVNVLPFAGPASRSSQSGGWWRQPLPAWAQVAAAVVIFAAGMGVSAMRSTDSATPLATATQGAGVVGRFVGATPVSHDELARLDARLRSVESAQAEGASVQPARTTAAAVNEQELFERVRALVDNQVAVSEGRQRGLLMLTRGELNQTTQRVDGVTQRLALMEDELPRTQEGLRTLSQLAVRTSYQPPSSGR
jgi:hypothetical protein